MNRSTNILPCCIVAQVKTHVGIVNWATTWEGTG